MYAILLAAFLHYFFRLSKVVHATTFALAYFWILWPIAMTYLQVPIV